MNAEGKYKMLAVVPMVRQIAISHLPLKNLNDLMLIEGDLTKKQIAVKMAKQSIKDINANLDLLEKKIGFFVKQYSKDGE